MEAPKLNIGTIALIEDTMAKIPEKYWSKQPSLEHSMAVIREEYLELEQEVFFGEKAARSELLRSYEGDADSFENEMSRKSNQLHKERIREEALQLIGTAVRMIQELT